MTLPLQSQIDAYHWYSCACSIARIPPTGLLPHLLIAACGNTRGGVPGISKPAAGRGIRACPIASSWAWAPSELALTSALVPMLISPTSLTVECLARARDD